MCTAEKLNGSTSLENYNMCYVSFRIREQENAYLGVVEFKTEDQKFLRRLLIFTPIPLDAEDMWSLNQFSKERMKSVQHSHTNHFILCMILMKDLMKVS